MLKITREKNTYKIYQLNTSIVHIVHQTNSFTLQIILNTYSTSTTNVIQIFTHRWSSQGSYDSLIVKSEAILTPGLRISICWSALL